ncbi:esterase/lipase family protein [Zafaria cholistanensis]|uniref:esterase/lipase family protein n=1 Tax=Zafaria cholistanensis TaxID=1682741 RepID=UPI001CED6DF4|nr:alpha/beta hydrolase [Zafaria cholistanensis]
MAYWQIHALLFPADHRHFLEGTGPGTAPVVLLPGIYETWQFLHPVAERLHAAGHPVHVVKGLGYNHGTVPDMAHVVSRYLEENDLRGVLLVAHSKGGLIGKYVMSASDQAWRVERMTAINTPFSGSVYARFAPLRSLRDFSPRNAGLLKLARNLEINHRIVSVYSAFDPHIPGGSFLEGAVNIKLDTMGHFRPIGDSRLLAVVEEQVAGLS